MLQEVFYGVTFEVNRNLNYLVSLKEFKRHFKLWNLLAVAVQFGSKITYDFKSIFEFFFEY